MEKESTVTSQPGPVPQMDTLPGNRNVKNLPLDRDGKRGWSFSLCGCCGACGPCCLACWCPCLLNAQNQRRLEHLNTQGYPDPRRDELVIGDSFFYACLEVAFDMGWILQVGNRKNTRERYNIRGNGCSDVCAPLCCQMCDLVQVHREISLEENSFPSN